MHIVQVIVLGIVEGISEFLPISSTGHLILTGKILGVTDSSYTKSFDIIIQSGAILAAVFYFRDRIFSGLNLWKYVLAAFFPTAIIGYILYSIIKHYFLSNSMLVVWMLFIGGVVLIFFEKWYEMQKHHEKVTTDHIGYKRSIMIGLAQSLAMIPGVSRSAATIVGGMLLGVKREVIVEFSFLLAIPTMLAATVLDLTKTGGDFSLDQVHFLIIGFLISFLVALASIHWLLSYIRKHTFIGFGIYRIFVAIAFWFLVVR